MSHEAVQTAQDQDQAPYEMNQQQPSRTELDMSLEVLHSNDAVHDDASPHKEKIPRTSGSDLQNGKDVYAGMKNDVEKSAGINSSPSSSNTEPVAAKDANLVEWDGPDDPENPMNFSFGRKVLITGLFSSLTLWATFSSSIFSTATGVTSQEYQVSVEVMTLGTSLPILGFATGPLIWGPMSELHGRVRPLLFAFGVFVIFQIPVAVATNLETIMLGRFFTGFFGTAALAITPGSLIDFWGPVERAAAISALSAATFVGTIFGPIVGGFLVDSYLGWRWTAWIIMIPAAVCGVISLIILPETYHPVLHQRRAARLRQETRNWAYHSRLDETRPTIRDIVFKYLLRPLRMLSLEPILGLVTLYIALIYGILYLFFESFPISFTEVRGWTSLGVAALPFLGIIIGVLIGCVFVTWATQRWYAPKMKSGTVTPEDRLPPMMSAAICLPVGLFWFGWTSDPGVPWPAQVVAGVPIGFGILVIWMQGLNYLIDVYLMFANSALAANTLIRSIVGAAFPLFATAMYERLGVAWATSLLAFLSTAMVPIPLLFYFYGAKIRARSRYNPRL